MRRKVIWVAVALALVAIPAVVGLVLVGGDDSSSEARRAGALIQAGPVAGGGYQVTIDGLTPPGQAIDTMSFSWGVENTGSAHAGAGAGAGKAKVQDISFTKKLDETSPKLFEGAATGKHYTRATLTLYGASADYATYELTDVLVTQFQVSGSGNEVPTENVSLNFAKIKLTASSVSGKGAKGGTATFGWDLQANTKF